MPPVNLSIEELEYLRKLLYAITNSCIEGKAYTRINLPQECRELTYRTLCAICSKLTHMLMDEVVRKEL